MATAAATAASSMAHQIPPMPRIRPPRMLKGEPHPNNAPVPREQLPSQRKMIWVQGKYRSAGSRAVGSRQATHDIQIAKALRHQTRGLDIYAYRHIRTNQVVYSLTRTLQENKILKQLLFHGKKTVPSTVRNDMWTPYFSIHFPPTPAGALEGLFAFQKLRELSMQRQLSPTDDLIKVTQEDIDVIKSKIGSPTTLQEMAVREELRGKIPKVDEILPKKLRARKLMDHKATSVADAAFVLDWILSGPSPWERVTKVATSRAVSAAEMTFRSTRRLQKIRQGIEKKALEIRKRAAHAVQDLAHDDQAHIRLTLKTVQQLSLEHHRLISGDGHSLSKADKRREIDLQHLEAYEDKTVRQVKESGYEAAIEGKEARKVFKERQKTVKEAEREAIDSWFERNASPTTGSGSVWNEVSLARENALDTFDKQHRSAVQLSSTNSQPGNPSAKQVPVSSPSTGSDSIQSQLDTLTPDWATEPRKVKVYWADINDGLFASSWPKSVIHGSLEPFGVAKGRIPIRNNILQEYWKHEEIKSKTVHVIGSGQGDGWMPNQFSNGIIQPREWEERPDMAAEENVESQGVETESDPSVQVSSHGYEPLDENIVLEEKPKGIWGRVKGLFGR